MTRVIKKIYCAIRFGAITSKVKESVSGVAAEVEFYDRKGKTVGYWAYGAFDPSLPYRGQDGDADLQAEFLK